ncbi:MAG: maleylpyruvate isomerase family mycothiol-dependent enzyme [Actinomycetota bacterium]|nr:maleylpyruvate isomerase family mycothiol-dependent enzyme [Actinomycetota bacterium]
MADIGEVYDVTRKELSNFVSSLSEGDLKRPVPATPGWSIRDVIAHHSGAVEDLAAGDFPREFFFAIGSEEGVAALNEWTGRQVGDRPDRTLQDMLDAWEEGTAAIIPMLRGEVPWPGDVLPFAGHVLMTDLAVHQQDIYGALGLVKDRDEAPVAIGFSTYRAGIDFRIQASGGPSLRFVTEDTERVAGGGEPIATVRATRFELFRALSGRRSQDQIRAYEWQGDPEPFLEFFYPYGVREEALVE